MNKRFSERLNKELDSMGVPETSEERIAVLAKLIRVPKFKAESLLAGIASPNEEILTILANELEVSAQWLIGKDVPKGSEH